MDASAEIVQKLEHIARWHATANLTNPESTLEDSIEMLVVPWIGAPTTLGGDPQTDTVESGQELRLPYRMVAGQLEPGRFTIKLRNTGNQPLFFSLLALSESFAVQQIRNGYGRLVPGETIWLRSQDGIPASVPDTLYRQGVTQRRDIVLLLISEQDVDFSLIEQQKLDMPYMPRQVRSMGAGSVLEKLMQRVGTMREIDDGSAQITHQWSALKQTVVAERPLHTHHLDGSAQTYHLTEQVQLQAPEGLSADVRLVSASQAGRTLYSALLPPGLDTFSTALQPVALAGQVGSDRGVSTLKLTGTDFSAVTEFNPLCVSTALPVEPDEALLALAYDGQDYLLVGMSNPANRAEIIIPTLPRPLAPEELDEQQRGFARTLWILFQKLTYTHLGLAEKYHYPLLRRAVLDESSTLDYQEVTRSHTQQARNIVLVLHGINSDTHGMTQTMLQANVLETYDLILVLDYESFNTRVPETARTLKKRLKDIGLSSGHGKRVDCIAHSMGGLVARWLIEREQGDGLIQHLIMLGTPNEGSPLPKVQDWVFLSIGLALGSFASLPPFLSLEALLGGFEHLDVALDELAPGSATLSDLNSSALPTVPYTAIAGNAGTSEQWQRLSEKILHQSASMLFPGETHDLAVGYTSMTRIRSGDGTQPHIITVPCTHLDYFDSEAGQSALLQVLGALRNHQPDAGDV
jgi:pimeloyl-ACP methyl ester carboxylesterase